MRYSFYTLRITSIYVPAIATLDTPAIPLPHKTGIAPSHMPVITPIPQTSLSNKHISISYIHKLDINALHNLYHDCCNSRDIHIRSMYRYRGTYRPHANMVPDPQIIHTIKHHLVIVLTVLLTLARQNMFSFFQIDLGIPKYFERLSELSAMCRLKTIPWTRHRKSGSEQFLSGARLNTKHLFYRPSAQNTADTMDQQ